MFKVEAVEFIMEPLTKLDSSGRGHATEGDGYVNKQGIGAAHASVGGFGKYFITQVKV